VSPATIGFRNRKETVGGKVTVCIPSVERTMTVDVQFDELCRRDQSAGIGRRDHHGGGLTNAVYVGRPVFARQTVWLHSSSSEPDGHSAKRVVVQFGATSVNLIEIKSGLQAGDMVIISDMSQYDGVAAIVLRVYGFATVLRAPRPTML